MSEITGIIDALESRIGMLIKKIDDLQAQNSVIKSQLAASEADKRKQVEEISKLKSSYDTLKLTNILIGGDESKM